MCVHIYIYTYYILYRANPKPLLPALGITDGTGPKTVLSPASGSPESHILCGVLEDGVCLGWSAIHIFIQLKSIEKRVSAKVPGIFGVHYQLCWMMWLFLLTDNWTIHDISGYFRFIAVRSGLVAHFAALWILPQTTTITYSARGQTSPGSSCALWCGIDMCIAVGTWITRMGTVSCANPWKSNMEIPPFSWSWWWWWWWWWSPHDTPTSPYLTPRAPFRALAESLRGSPPRWRPGSIPRRNRVETTLKTAHIRPMSQWCGLEHALKLLKKQIQYKI